MEHPFPQGFCQLASFEELNYMDFNRLSKHSRQDLMGSDVFHSIVDYSSNFILGPEECSLEESLNCLFNEFWDSGQRISSQLFESISDHLFECSCDGVCCILWPSGVSPGCPYSSPVTSQSQSASPCLLVFRIVSRALFKVRYLLLLFALRWKQTTRSEWLISGCLLARNVGTLVPGAITSIS